jgi:hypothetical protein
VLPLPSGGRERHGEAAGPTGASKPATAKPLARPLPANDIGESRE